MLSLPFTPAADVAAILNALLDIYERHDPTRPFARAIRVRLDELDLPGYASQLDPAPRQTANEQLQALEQRGFVRLTWLPGDVGHLLDAVTLFPERAAELFPWLGRPPVAAQVAALRALLFGTRFRFTDGDWRLLALDHTLAQLRAGKSPAPFTLADPAFNRDLLAALVALDAVREETPYRVFSVRAFNDSKAFEPLKAPLANLARRHGPGWDELTAEEALRELRLTPNPTHILLYGPWRLVRAGGQVVSLDGFYPAVGVPSVMMAGVEWAEVDTAQVDRVVCVENLASFYELIRYEGERLAALCLWGNPAPAVRHLLARLAESLPAEIPLRVWADLDYGGLHILAQLRRQISPRFLPYQMDAPTLDTHVRWARPLTENDRRLLARLQGYDSLADLQGVIAHMLERGLKLEQEAVQLASDRLAR
ncbi:MAG: Wadjet anti-phage system protein JetD domain-containing protein [Nitrososphaerales archaeon]